MEERVRIRGEEREGGEREREGMNKRFQGLDKDPILHPCSHLGITTPINQYHACCLMPKSGTIACWESHTVPRTDASWDV